MAIVPKDWQDAPSTATPITAVALEDMETRLGAYTDLKTVVNVRESPYSALGNGSNDDSAEIQAAIDAVNAAGGGTVFIPRTASYYKIGSYLALRANVRLTGEGYGSCLQKDATDNNDVIRVDNITNFEIDHLRVRNSTVLSDFLHPGAGSAFGIRVTNGCSKGSVHHNYVERSCLGIGVLDLTPGTPSFEISVTDNIVSNIGINGIGVASVESDICVARNQITNFGQDATLALLGAGVEWAGPIGGSISHNLIRDGNFTNSAVDGIRVSDEPAQGLVCVGNDIATVSGYGIRMTGSIERCIVADNLIDTPTKHGIYLVSSADGNIQYNTFRGNIIKNPDAGVVLEGAGGTQVRRNEFVGTVVVGAGWVGHGLLAACDDNDFRDGRISAGGNYGVYHNDGDRNRFRGYVVMENVGYGFFVANALATEFIECHAYDKRGTQLQTWGLNIDATCTGINVVGGRYGPNLSGTVQDGGTATVQTGVRAAYT